MSGSAAPSTVKIAFWILLIGVILEAISGVMMILAGVAIGSAGEVVETQGIAISGPLLIGTGVATLVIAVIEVLVLSKMKQGKNWARVLITILELLGLLAIFTGASGLSIATIVVSVVAVVLMWVPTSNAYFRRA